MRKESKMKEREGYHVEGGAMSEKCWCKRPGERRVQKHEMHTGRDYYTMGTTEIAKFCPDCGEKIEYRPDIKSCKWCESWKIFKKGGVVELEATGAEFLHDFITAVYYLITRDQPMTECPECWRKL